MAKVVPYILAAVEFYTGNYAAGAITLAGAIAGTYEQHRTAQQAKRAYNDSLQDRFITIRSGVSTRQYVLGEARVGATLMYADTVGVNKEALDMVLAFAGNRCELLAYFLNEDTVDAADFQGFGLKYGKTELIQLQEHFTVTGPSTTVALSQRPKDLQPIVVAWTQNGSSGTGTGTIRATGTVLELAELPVGTSSVSVTYKVNGAEKLRTVFKDGDPDQDNTPWVDYATPSWSEDYRLQGICYLRPLLVWDETIWASGAPNFTLSLRGKEVEGHPFYDPRVDDTVAYTRNPAILAGWWMTLDRRRGGCGVPSDWIDWSSIAVAANICDEIISGLGIRYECNTVLDTANSPEDNLQIILSAMAGRKCFTAGKYKFVAGAFRPAIVTITDADVVGDKPISVLTGNASDPPPNIVTATFVDASTQWRETSPVPVVNESYITRDGHETTRDMRLAATTDARQAHYLMGVQLETERPAFGLTLSVGGVGEDLAVYDCVQLNLSNRPSYSGRTFEILSIGDPWDGTFELTLAEIKPGTWALDPNSFTPTNPATLPDLSYLWNIPALTGFIVQSVSPTQLSDGTAVTQVVLAWNPHPGKGIAQGGHIELRYREASSAEWIIVAALPGDAAGTTITAHLKDGAIYQFQARAMNSIGALSDWADAWQQITGVPFEPKSFRLRVSSIVFHVPVSGTVTPSAISFTVAREGGLANAASFTTSPGGITLGGSGDARTLAYTDLPPDVDTVQVTAQISEDSKVFIDQVTIARIRDGADGPDYVPDLTAPPPPTGLTATAALFHIQLQWDAPTYTVGHGPASTEIYAALVPPGGPQPTFADAVPIGGTPGRVSSHDVGTAETWAYWIKHKSVDGVLSLVPAGGTNGVQATSGKIGNADLNPLIIDAGKLADGSITPQKVAAGAIDATKFASGIEPVLIVVSLPNPAGYTGPKVLLFGGELYRYNGSAWTKAVAVGDVAGDFPTNRLNGLIAGTQIADGAISTPKLAANSVTATQIAAGAISTDKLLVQGRGAALNSDPSCVDISAWVSGGPTISVTGPDNNPVPGGTYLTIVSSTSTPIASKSFPVTPGKTYRLSALAAASIGSTGVFYLRLDVRDSAGIGIAYNIGVEGVTLDAVWARYGGNLVVPATGVTADIAVYANYTGSGTTWIADVRVEEVLPGTLIQDGAITTDKILANAITTGKIATGAVNAQQIAAGAITTSKLLVTGQGAALNGDPGCVDQSAWQYREGGSFQLNVSSSVAPNGTVIRCTGSTGLTSVKFPVSAGKRYRVSGFFRKVSGDGFLYLGVLGFAAGVPPEDNINYSEIETSSAWGAALPPASVFTRFMTGVFTVPAGVVTAVIYLAANWTGSGVTDGADLRFEEAIEGELIVDGAITAGKLAANSITVGTAAVQNGAIVNAMIGNLAVDDAKITSLSGTKILANTIEAASIKTGTITADRLALLAAGGTSIDMSAGRIVFNNGAYMKVMGTGFGSVNQFIEWYGPTRAVASCDEASATYYLRTDGQAYFGGALLAGVLRNSVQATNLTAGNVADLGPFSSNGNQITITFSYAFSARTFFAGTSAGLSAYNGTLKQTPSFTIVLSCSLGGGAFVDVSTLSGTGTHSEFPPNPSDVAPGAYNQDMGGSSTYVDPSLSTLSREYRLRITSLNGVNASVISNTLAIQSIEH